jgi:hypothetical protein
MHEQKASPLWKWLLPLSSLCGLAVALALIRIPAVCVHPRTPKCVIIPILAIAVVPILIIGPISIVSAVRMVIQRPETLRPILIFGGVSLVAYAYFFYKIWPVIRLALT